MKLISPGGQVRHRLDDDEIERLYSVGWSRCKIARHVGATQGTIDQRLMKRGVKFRGHAEAARLGYRLGLNNMKKGLDTIHHGPLPFKKRFSIEGKLKLSEARARSGKWVGPLNPMWRGVRSERKYKRWDSIRRIIREKYGNKCARCPTEENLDVHHIVPIRLTHDNSLANLILLCRKCHKREERASLFGFVKEVVVQG